MSSFTEADLPVSIDHEEWVTLSGGTTVRFETNGEAKDIYLHGEFTPVIQLFPDCEYCFEDNGKPYRLRAMFEDRLVVERA